MGKAPPEQPRSGRPGPLPRRRGERRAELDGGHVLVEAAHRPAPLGRAPDRGPRRGDHEGRGHHRGADRARDRRHPQGPHRRPQAALALLLRVGVGRRHLAGRAHSDAVPTELGPAAHPRGLVLPGIQQRLFPPACRRRRKRPRPGGLPGRLHLCRAARRQRPATRPDRRQRPAFLPRQVPPLPLRRGAARAPPHPPRGAHLGRPRGGEQLHRQPPGAVAAAARRRLPGGVRVAPADGLPERPLPDLQAHRARADGRPVPARRAPVPDRGRRRQPRADPRRGADAVADRLPEGVDRTLEDHRERGRHRADGLWRRSLAGQLGRLRQLAHGVARGDRAGRGSRTSCS